MSKRGARKEAARIVRDQLARERRRQRTMWTSIAAVAVLVIAGMVGYGIYTSQRADEFTAPPGAVDDGAGIAVGTGPVRVDVYEDFICPACGQFEKAGAGTVDQLAAQGKVKAVYHPLAFLDRMSTTDYSTRSAAASGCAAAGGKFREYAKALFAQQPPEGGSGLSDDQLIEIGTSVGLTGDSFATCVSSGRYKPWTTHVTDAAGEKGVHQTPTVLVNGAPVQNPTGEQITAAVEAAGT